MIVDNWEVSEERFRARMDALLNKDLQPLLRANKVNLSKKKLSAITFIPEHRADENHIIVGAASILAKVASDQQYKKYTKIYGNFGSGSPGDPQTRLFVWQHRHNPLPIIRTSWKTYQTLVKLENIEDDVFYGRVMTNKHKKVDSTISCPDRLPSASL